MQAPRGLSATFLASRLAPFTEIPPYDRPRHPFPCRFAP
jgi:hypothetical protein